MSPPFHAPDPSAPEGDGAATRPVAGSDGPAATPANAAGFGQADKTELVPPHAVTHAVALFPADTSAALHVLAQAAAIIDAGGSVALDLSGLPAVPRAGTRAMTVVAAMQLVEAVVARLGAGSPDEVGPTEHADAPRLDLVLRVDHPDIERFLTTRPRVPPTVLGRTIALSDEFLDAARRRADFVLLDPADLAVVASLGAGPLFDRLVEEAWLHGPLSFLFIDRADDVGRADAAAPVRACPPRLDVPLPSGGTARSDEASPRTTVLRVPRPPEPAVAENTVWDALRSGHLGLRWPPAGGASRTPANDDTSTATGGLDGSGAEATITRSRSDGSAGAGVGVGAATPRARPDRVQGWTYRMESGCGTVYVTVNEDDEGPVEVIAVRAKAHACASAQLSAACRVLSLALRARVPPHLVVERLRGVRCSEPHLAPDGVVYGCVDAVGKALERHFFGPGLADEVAGRGGAQRQAPLERFSR